MRCKSLRYIFLTVMVPEILREIKQVHASRGIELKIRSMLCSRGLQHVASP